MIAEHIIPTQNNVSCTVPPPSLRPTPGLRINRQGFRLCGSLKVSSRERTRKGVLCSFFKIACCTVRTCCVAPCTANPARRTRVRHGEVASNRASTLDFSTSGGFVVQRIQLGERVFSISYRARIAFFF